MKSLMIGAVLLLGVALQAGAQGAITPGPKGKHAGGDCGILYGKFHTLTFCAPKGWLVNNHIMNQEGIYAVLYRDGSNWHEAQVSGSFMYINVIARKAGNTVETQIADDAADVKKREPKAEIEKGKTIRIGDISAPVQQFLPGAYDRYEAVAYIGEPKVLVLFVITSKDKRQFKKDYASFERLVQSYKFLGSSVTIEHAQPPPSR